MEVRFIQLSNIAAQTRDAAGERHGGVETSCSKRVWYSRMTKSANSSREPKVGEYARLAHAR